MGYEIVHRYVCDSCGFKMDVKQAVYGGKVDYVDMPGFDSYGGLYLCSGCAEAITPSIEEGIERIRRRNELRTQYGQ
jgi:uncharacterized protein YlaI